VNEFFLSKFFDKIRLKKKKNFAQVNYV